MKFSFSAGKDANYFMVILLLVTFGIFSSIRSSGQTLRGLVYEDPHDGHDHDPDPEMNQPLAGVNVYWVGTTRGTVTNAHGKFSISKSDIQDHRLVFSLLGFKRDTVDVAELTRLEWKMIPDQQELSEVEIKARQDNTFTSKLNPVYTQVITQGELQRAACCNLAESFETNAAVDVSYSDAVTGAKQIQLLGLSGTYSQIMAEKIPMIRGLATPFGLGYIPGPWMESIQVSKGISSVSTGPESISGSINVEFKKPETSEKLYLNLFGNSNLRFELNGNSAYRINEKLSTMVFVHGSDFRQKIDHNDDGFMDMPMVTNINLFNRWDYNVPGKYISRFGIRYLYENRKGGQMDFNPDGFEFDTVGIGTNSKKYGIGINTNRIEAFWKNGVFLPGLENASIGLILYGVNHIQRSFYGINQYSGHEQMLYANLSFNAHLAGEEHQLTAGISFSQDVYNEHFLQTNLFYDFTDADDSLGITPGVLVGDTVIDHVMNRNEKMTGIYLEYTLDKKDRFSMILGGRIDYLNTYGLMYAPRLHLKWNIGESSIIRGSAGVGYRVPDVLAEHTSVYVSQRRLYFPEKLNPEIAWNYGINFTHDFKMFNHKAEFTFDIYRTDFINQVVTDLDRSPEAVWFTNLHGRSYANSLQAQLIFAPVHHFTITAAFRYNDVKTTINGELREKPLVSKYKGLLSLSYFTNLEKWMFDLTAQINGPQRLPDAGMLPPTFYQPAHSPAYIYLLGQITRKFKRFEIYVGGENLTNYRQKDLVQQYWAPYGTWFDGSKVWGPVMGITVYAGVRFAIK